MEQIECLYDRYIKDFRCKYYMTNTTRKYIDDKDTVKSYGVRIEKISKKGELLSVASVSNVGINENDVKTFIKKLKDGSVTPISLEYIVHDSQM